MLINYVLTERVLREVKQNPAPVFQILDLSHLPNEVLDNIFWLASMEQAKALSMTCRRLNDVGQRQIFKVGILRSSDKCRLSHCPSSSDMAYEITCPTAHQSI